MKRIAFAGPVTPIALLVVALLLAPSFTRAADPGVPPEVHDRLQRLGGLVDDLLASQAVLQKRLAALTDELQAVREENARIGDKFGDRFATRDEVRRLAESIREMDRKREDDKRLILEELKKLAQTPVVVPPSRETPRPAAPKDPVPEGPTKGYKYIIKSGDTLSAIAQAYAQSGVKVTADDIQKANPTIKPQRLPVGKEIFIPDPNLK